MFRLVNPEVEQFLQKNPVKIKGYGLPDDFHSKFTEFTGLKEYKADYKSPKSLTAHFDLMANKGHQQTK